MEFDASDLTLQQAYKLMTGVVVPRPIAWVSTLNAEGKINLAPFSAFTFVSHDPPMIAISVGMRDGEIKDTARNILAREEFVVNVANLALLDAVHQSSGDYPPEVSEVDVLGLAVHPSHHIQTPRIAQAPAALECRLHQCLELGREPSRLIIGEVLRFHVRDGLAVNNKIATAELDPLSRLGGPNYAALGQIFTVA
jgi:flavin reductase (DIM6/NTAB) family NADH-FMN oxidoreductase RutF